jgi:outer membrane protein assembly factor BamB
MNRTLLLCTVLLAACDPLFGSPAADRQACAGSAECPAGQYCALVEPRACWDDPAPPLVSAVTVRCSTSPCLRDATLTVEATVSDEQELGPVTVALDLDGGARQVEMVRVAGALHRATLDLAEWPLPGVEAAVVATVQAVDGARQATARSAQAGQRPLVTRVRPVVEVGVTPTAPALMPDGTVVLGGADGRLRFLPPGATTVSTSAASFGLSVAQPPTVGQGAIWVVSGNNRLYAASLDGSAVLNGTGYDTGGVVAGPAAVTAAVPTAGAPEVAFVGSAGGRMAAVQADAVANGFIARTVSLDPFTAGSVLLDDSRLFGATESTAPVEVTLRRFNFDGALGEGSTRTVGNALAAPLAIASNGAVWTASADVTLATLQQTNPDGSAGASIALGASPGGGAVVLANGDVAICVGNELRRYTSGGEPAWAAPAPLTGAGLTPIALAGPGAAATLLVPTRSGTVDAVRASDGARLWSASLTVNVELREGTVRAAAGARASTAWFTSSDGLLHGLVVDGALDPAAPWPKAWHDPRNTGNLSAAP